MNVQNSGVLVAVVVNSIELSGVTDKGVGLCPSSNMYLSLILFSGHYFRCLVDETQSIQNTFILGLT